MDKLKLKCCIHCLFSIRPSWGHDFFDWKKNIEDRKFRDITWNLQGLMMASEEDSY